LPYSETKNAVNKATVTATESPCTKAAIRPAHFQHHPRDTDGLCAEGPGHGACHAQTEATPDVEGAQASQAEPSTCISMLT
jgi:hypothetical protein